MSGATGNIAAGATVTPPPRGKNSGHLNRHPGAPGGARPGVQDFFSAVSPSSYMSTAWSSPGTSIYLYNVFESYARLVNCVEEEREEQLDREASVNALLRSDPHSHPTTEQTPATVPTKPST